MNNKKICRGTAVLLAALLCAASCKDMSDPKNIQEHTAKPYTFEETTTESDEDDFYAEIVEDFTTTGSSAAPVEAKAMTTEDTSSAEQTTADTPAVTTTETEAVTTTAASAEKTSAAQTTSAAPETSAAQTPAAAPAGEINYNVIGQNGILVSYQDGHYRGIMPCFGTYSACEKWASALNTFAEKLPGVNVYSMEMPIASEFYTPQKYWDSGFTTVQKNKIDNIGENLSGVTHVDAYTALSQHTAENIYSRTDHHWTPYGAYFAAQQFAKAAGADFPSLDQYTPVSLGGYVGSMYTYSKDAHLYNDPETFTMYISPNADRITTTYYNTSFGGAYEGDLFVARNAGAYYCSFLGSDDRIAKIETDVKNGRTLVVFKQSFGNALIPFLTSGFEKIYVCDMRYFNLNAIQFCKDVGATDLLCTDCIMIAAGNGGTYLTGLQNR